LTVADERFYPLSGNLRVFMLPDDYYTPSCGSQLGLRLVITLNVPRKLCLPPCSIGARKRTMFRTGVPEATADIHCHLRSGKDDVHGSAEVGQYFSVHPETAGPQGAERPDPAPDQQDRADSGEDRPDMDGDPSHEQQCPGDGANGGTVVTSEEKRHGSVPFLIVAGWIVVRRG
jgi:hypothetical protein